jgi:hypothetical protein
LAQPCTATLGLELLFPTLLTGIANLSAVTVAAMPDDLLALVSSHDSTLRYNLETKFSGGLGGHFAGGEWRIDATHNQIAAITNGGTRPTDALLTLHYDNGEKKYDLQQRIAPGEQMWVNLAELIHKRVPDRKGNTLPVDVSTVTFDLQDLTPRGHSLMENDLAVDSTWGFRASPGCPTCCGYDLGSIIFNPDPAGVALSAFQSLALQASNACNYNLEDISLLFWLWGSDNSSIAKVTTKQVQGIAPGETLGWANGMVPGGPGSCACSFYPESPTVPITVGIAITSIDPDTAMIGSNSVQITINGYGFGSSPTVNLPTGFTSSGQGSSDTKIVITVDIGYTATIGNNGISVTGPTGTSNAANFVVDGPYHMTVEGDVTDHCTGCQTTVRRRVTYQIQNFSGTNAGVLNLGENFTTTGWSCQQPNPGISTNNCTSNPAVTNSSGVFTDSWTLSSDAYTPTGCGYNTTDHWQWCGHTPVQTLGTLTGYIHTDHISINGVVSPNQIPNGTVIPF